MAHQCECQNDYRLYLRAEDFLKDDFFEHGYKRVIIEVLLQDINNAGATKEHCCYDVKSLFCNYFEEKGLLPPGSEDRLDYRSLLQELTSEISLMQSLNLGTAVRCIVCLLDRRLSDKVVCHRCKDGIVCRDCKDKLKEDECPNCRLKPGAWKPMTLQILSTYEPCPHPPPRFSDSDTKED